jgi:uncharacterized DUF497 family protein
VASAVIPGSSSRSSKRGEAAAGLTFTNYRIYNNYVKIEFDPAKREWTLRERGLDFARAGVIFDRYTLTLDDRREDYGEERFVSYGVLDGVVVACVWTQRGEARRLISLRKAKKNERENYNFNRP